MRPKRAQEFKCIKDSCETIPVSIMWPPGMGCSITLNPDWDLRNWILHDE